MRQLQPNRRPISTTPEEQGKARILTVPSSALRHLERIQLGEVSICLSRAGGGIGDVLMTTPLIRQVKKNFPDCHLTYATSFGYLDGALPKVLKGNPYIDKITESRLVKPEQFEAFVDLTCPCIAHEKPGAAPINRIDLFAAHAQVVLEDHSMTYCQTEEERSWGLEWLLSRGLRPGQTIPILLNPNASHPRRSWDPWKWKELAVRLTAASPQFLPIFVSHASDRNKEDWKLRGCVVMHDYDIRHIAAVLWHCALVVCPDSAILHLAQALDKKTVALFGPTDPRARCNYSPNTIAICHGPSISYWPCYYDGNCGCKLQCFRSLEPEEVAITALKHLAGDNPPQPITVAPPTPPLSPPPKSSSGSIKTEAV